jgi:hypothetical protein
VELEGDAEREFGPVAGGDGEEWVIISGFQRGEGGGGRSGPSNRKWSVGVKWK